MLPANDAIARRPSLIGFLTVSAVKLAAMACALVMFLVAGFICDVARAWCWLRELTSGGRNGRA